MARRKYVRGRAFDTSLDYNRSLTGKIDLMSILCIVAGLIFALISLGLLYDSNLTSVGGWVMGALSLVTFVYMFLINLPN